MNNISPSSGLRSVKYCLNIDSRFLPFWFSLFNAMHEALVEVEWSFKAIWESENTWRMVGGNYHTWGMVGEIYHEMLTLTKMRNNLKTLETSWKHPETTWNRHYYSTEVLQIDWNLVQWYIDISLFWI